VKEEIDVLGGGGGPPIGGPDEEEKEEGKEGVIGIFFTLSSAAFALSSLLRRRSLNDFSFASPSALVSSSYKTLMKEKRDKGRK